MLMKIPKNNHSLSDMVKDAIVQMITTDEFMDNKLPAESKLAERFGVSLAVVREALLLLREEGVVTKKHGSGNYFHLNALSKTKRMDRFPGFCNILESHGYNTQDIREDLRPGEPGQKIRSALKASDEDTLLYYGRQIFANGEPAIHCDIWLPAKLFRTPPSGDTARQFTFFEIFSECFGMELAYGNMEFFPYLTTELEQKQICADVGSPIIIMEEIYYSLQDVPMAYSVSKFNHKYITINMLSR